MPAGLGALAVLVNLTYLPEENYFYLPLYLGAALLLVGHTALAEPAGLVQPQRQPLPQARGHGFSDLGALPQHHRPLGGLVGT